MRKKKQPETTLPPNLIQEGPAIGLPKDPTSEVIQDKPVTPTITQAAELFQRIVQDKPWTQQRWDYEHLPASGPHPNAEYYAKFKKLGEDGWEFIGKDSYGRNVFKRPGQS